MKRIFSAILIAIVLFLGLAVAPEQSLLAGMHHDDMSAPQLTSCELGAECAMAGNACVVECLVSALDTETFEAVVASWTWTAIVASVGVFLAILGRRTLFDKQALALIPYRDPRIILKTIKRE